MAAGWMLGKLIDALERRLGVPGGLPHMRQLAAASRPLFFRLLRVAAVAGYRRRLPADAFAVGSLTATALEGCGACLQMGIHEALRAGVALPVVQAAATLQRERLPAPLQAVQRFAIATAGRSPDLDHARDQVRSLYGEAGLVELASAVATARVFPVFKRALGHATHCEPLRFGHPARAGGAA